MESNFRRELMGEWKVDEEFELYLDSWMVYYNTSDLIDGHIEIPKNKEEYALTHLAMARGGNAQKNFLIEKGVDLRNRDMKKWRRSKLEALRRLERGI